MHYDEQHQQRDRHVAGLRGEDAAPPPPLAADVGVGDLVFARNGHHAASFAPVIKAVASSGLDVLDQLVGPLLAAAEHHDAIGDGEDVGHAV